MSKSIINHTERRNKSLKKKKMGMIWSRFRSFVVCFVHERMGGSGEEGAVMVVALVSYRSPVTEADEGGRDRREEKFNFTFTFEARSPPLAWSTAKWVNRLGKKPIRTTDTLSAVMTFQYPAARRDEKKVGGILMLHSPRRLLKGICTHSSGQEAYRKQ